MEATEAAGHRDASLWLRAAVRKQARLALAPQVLAEFVHVVTDPARFARPLDVASAINRTQAWWTALVTTNARNYAVFSPHRRCD
jgi:predicted nucleic acid-binding protein